MQTDITGLYNTHSRGESEKVAETIAIRSQQPGNKCATHSIYEHFISIFFLSLVAESEEGMVWFKWYKTVTLFAEFEVIQRYHCTHRYETNGCHRRWRRRRRQWYGTANAKFRSSLTPTNLPNWTQTGDSKIHKCVLFGCVLDLMLVSIRANLSSKTWLLCIVYSRVWHRLDAHSTQTSHTCHSAHSPDRRCHLQRCKQQQQQQHEPKMSRRNRRENIASNKLNLHTSAWLSRAHESHL